MPPHHDEQPTEAGADAKDEGFSGYLAEADRLGMDLNDYLEKKAGWGDCLHLLEPSTFPYFSPEAVILELGPGSGRWSRHLAARLTSGVLHLVDNSPWKVDFLREYFGPDGRVQVHLNDGFALTEFADESVDLVCSYGTFIYFQLGQIYRYAQEFLRVLRPGGHVVLDFIDIDTDTGWQWLLEHSDEHRADCFTYHTAEVIEHLFQFVGFDIVVSRDYLEDFNFIVLRKPTGSG